MQRHLQRHSPATETTIRLVSTDVFDTLLLRNGRSERSRIRLGEGLFAGYLVEQGRPIAADVLVDTRMSAQKLAFRAFDVGGVKGEVRLVDIIERQLAMLGLPPELVEERLRIEVEVEKRSLTGNRELAGSLRRHKALGRRVVAISDTTLPAAKVRELIHHFHSPDLIDHVYSSADRGLTKRDGSIFVSVAQDEGVGLHEMLHVGDDERADVRVPASLGINTRHMPRPAYLGYLRAANGGVTETRRRLARTPSRRIRLDEPHAFGRMVFGPILTELSLLTWLYEREAERRDRTVLLFCARGGIGMREAFERVVDKFSLPIEARRENLMISRLIAARACLVAGAPSALEELGREFKGETSAKVANALGGGSYRLPAPWHETFSPSGFATLLATPSGVEALADISHQNALFHRHLEKLASGADRLILVDTGLYGSTQRMLADGFADLRIETIQFARANYKGHSESHFPKVTGLFVERNLYDPFDPRSCVLRYWHLVESLFEPACQSVKQFTQGADGEVVGNCGDIRHGRIDPAQGNPLLAGALSYIDDLAPDGAARAMQEARAAWKALKRAVTHPGAPELRAITLGERSVDFGRSGSVPVLSAQKAGTLPARLAGVKSQLWREGAIAREFPVLKHALLPLLGAIQSLRGFKARRLR